MGSTAAEDPSGACAAEGAVRDGFDGLAWRCTRATDGARRWNRCFVTGAGRATDQVETRFDRAGAATRPGTDGTSCWACVRDTSRERGRVVAGRGVRRRACACACAVAAPACEGDGDDLTGESWPLSEGCGPVAHLPEGERTECYRTADGATVAPHDYECVRRWMGLAGWRLVWRKHCGC